MEIKFEYQKVSNYSFFKKGNHPYVHKWYYGGEEISMLRSLSYLGIVCSSNEKVKTRATLADQANEAIFQLHKILNRFKTLRLSFALDLFDGLINPIVCYGCEVWGFRPAPDIERVHLSFLKRVLGVKKSSQNDFIYGLLGRYPMRIIRQCRILSYWRKIVSGKNHVMSMFYFYIMLLDLVSKKMILIIGYQALNNCNVPYVSGEGV